LPVSLQDVVLALSEAKHALYLAGHTVLVTFGLADSGEDDDLSKSRKSRKMEELL
jgi:hypothetical protein